MGDSEWTGSRELVRPGLAHEIGVAPVTGAIDGVVQPGITQGQFTVWTVR